MCIHTLYIFQPCGHITFAPYPLLWCANHASPPASSTSLSLQPPSNSSTPICPHVKGHPFRSRVIHRLCAPCDRERIRREQERQWRIKEANEQRIQVVSFDETKWKVAYGWDRVGDGHGSEGVGGGGEGRRAGGVGAAEREVAVELRQQFNSSQ